MFQAFVAVATPVAAAATAAAGKAKTLTLSPEQLRELMAAQGLSGAPKSPLAAHAAWLTHTFAGLFVIAALLLIVLLALQTTKQEGLSGTIGGKVESAYRGRIGMDAQVARLTTGIAISFVLFATLVSLSGI
jgi:protein translocase SecG subunit